MNIIPRIRSLADSTAKSSFFSIMTILALIAGGSLTASAFAEAKTLKIKLAPMPGIGHLIPDLATALGYFKDEGLEVETLNVMNYISDDFYSGKLLNDGTIDAEISWYQRVVFGIGNDQPLKAVFLIEDSPRIMISIANRLKDKIRSAADFKGRNIADSELESTRAYLTDYIASRAGLSKDSYTSHPEFSNLEQLVKGLKEGKIDVVTSVEPTTSKLLATKLVTPLYSMTDRTGTINALGHVWLARCLYLSPKFIKAHPDTVQRLVNVFTRTMRYINSHTADEIIAKLPIDYYAPDIDNDSWANYKKGKVVEIQKSYPLFTTGDYSIPPDTAKKICELLLSIQYDNTDEGQFRRKAAQSGKVKAEDTYDNRFVKKAMAEIK